MSVNRVIILGNLGGDPEVRHTQGGQAVCNFTVATSEKWTDKAGDKQETTEWHRVVVWGKTGEACGKYLSKGSKVYVEGKLSTRSWDDKDGNKRYSTEVIADQRPGSVQFLDQRDRPRDGANQRQREAGYGGKHDTAGAGYGGADDQPDYGAGPRGQGVPDDDIPF
jgi:single-strand DNA-binding protein